MVNDPFIPVMVPGLPAVAPKILLTDENPLFSFAPGMIPAVEGIFKHVLNHGPCPFATPSRSEASTIQPIGQSTERISPYVALKYMLDRLNFGGTVKPQTHPVSFPGRYARRQNSQLLPIGRIFHPDIAKRRYAPLPQALGGLHLAPFNHAPGQLPAFLPADFNIQKGVDILGETVKSVADGAGIGGDNVDAVLFQFPEIRQQPIPHPAM